MSSIMEDDLEELNIITDRCPQCGTNNVAFEVKFTWLVGPTLSYEYVWDSLAVCTKCKHSILATHVNIRTPMGINWGQKHAPGMLPNHADVHLLEISPPYRILEPPKHIPPEVEYFFTQAIRSHEAGEFDAAGGVFRKALEVGLKIKFPDYDGKLYDCIDKAKHEGKLTHDMADWAHTIRRLGNYALHDLEPFKKEEVDEIYDFLNALFYYLFTAPSVLSMYRARHNDEPQGE